MSGSRIRKEPVCLNCGQDVPGNFCSVCGQENIEPRENFRSLLTHFFNDFTHFDGKFFHTIRVLLFQPGELSKAYISGKRASYLHPIRMYLFISFVFFLFIYLTENLSSTADHSSQTPSIDSVTSVLINQITSLQKKQQPNDSGLGDFLIREKIIQLEKRKWQLKADTTKAAEIWLALNDSAVVFDSKDSSLVNAEWYELQQQQLAPEKRDSRTEHWIKKKIAGTNGKYSSGSDHAILTLHIFSATFLILLLNNIIGHLFTALHWLNLNKWVGGFFAILFPIYYYTSLKNFYQQTAGKTLLKTALLLLGSFLVFLIVFMLLFAFLVITLH